MTAAATGIPRPWPRLPRQRRRRLAGLGHRRLDVLLEDGLHALRRARLHRAMVVDERLVPALLGLGDDAEVEHGDGLVRIQHNRVLEQRLGVRELAEVIEAHSHVHDRGGTVRVPPQGALVVDDRLAPVAGVVEHVRELDPCRDAGRVLREHGARGVGALLLLRVGAIDGRHVRLPETLRREVDDAEDHRDAGEQPDLHLDRLRRVGTLAPGPHGAGPRIELELGLGDGLADRLLHQREVALRAGFGTRGVLGAAAGAADGLGHGSSDQESRIAVAADDSEAAARAHLAPASAALPPPRALHYLERLGRHAWGGIALRVPIICLAAASLLVLTCTNALAADEQKLTVRVLHTTDLHGALSAWDDWADRPAARGLEKVAPLIHAARADSVPTLLLDAGDALFGSALVAAWRESPRRDPEPVIAAMNALRYDAIAIGNHEFDAGRGTLDSAVARAKFPFLAANVVDARTGNPAYGSSIVREFYGVRIGVLGLTTPAIPAMMDSSLYTGLRFLDPIEVARREIPRLRGAERCDVVIALVHSGLERDPFARGGEAKPRIAEVPNENLGYRLAYEVQGLDVVILGHTHQVVQSAKIGGALVTQAGKTGEALGDVELSFTRQTSLTDWKLAGITASVAMVTDTVASDPALHALVAPYAEATHVLLDQIVADAPQPLTAPLGRFGDNPLWRLIHRCQLETSNADVSLAALFDPAQVIPAGPVRRRDLMRLYPYGNSLGVVELSGADLKATLEHAAAMLNAFTYDGITPVLKPDAPGFQFDGAFGVEYGIDLTKPEGARIVNLRWKGKPLDPNQRLKVVANSYRLAGGGDYVTLRRAKRLSQVDQPMTQLLVRWARDKKTLAAEDDASWTVLPDYAGAPERPLIDRLVRLGVATRDQVQQLGAGRPARGEDLTQWLERAFGKGVLGSLGSSASSAAGKNAMVGVALDWCERAARYAHYALASTKADPSFRRSLFAGVTGAGAQNLQDPLTRAQWLGMLSNLRFPTIRVLETTDFHGAILGGARERRSQRPIGTSAALAAAIARERAANPEGTVLIDGGDLFQGTMVSNLQFGRPVVEQMNLLAYKI